MRAAACKFYSVLSTTFACHDACRLAHRLTRHAATGERQQLQKEGSRPFTIATD